MSPKSPKIYFIFSLSLFLFLLSYSWPILAQNSEGSLESLQQKRREYEEKLDSLRKKEKTLKNEIAYMDTQINLTLTRIEEAQVAIKLREEELVRLEGDITLVGSKIESLAKTLEMQRQVFANRAAAAYKSQQVGVLEIFLGGPSSYNLSYFINRFKYLKAFEDQDSKFLKQMEETRQVFQAQKIILSDKKDRVTLIKGQIEAEKKKLENYKLALSKQKSEKQNLLSLTLNDESKYQRLLTQILSEIESVSRGLRGGVKLGDVKRGDVIAREGNSGCVVPSPSSSNPLAGAHLHFGVYKDGVAQDPKPYLERGELSWPESPTTVTQNFGDNYDFYMRNFGVPGHNALDMSAGYGSNIRAAADGVAYETGDSRQYGSWCNGLAKGIRVEHPNGLKTIYWHVL